MNDFVGTTEMVCHRVPGGDNGFYSLLVSVGIRRPRESQTGEFERGKNKRGREKISSVLGFSCLNSFSHFFSPAFFSSLFSLFNQKNNLWNILAVCSALMEQTHVPCHPLLISCRLFVEAYSNSCLSFSLFFVIFSPLNVFP